MQEPALTLILKPKGRGSWSPLTVTLDGPRACPLLIRAGQTITLGGVCFRICRVLP